MSALDIFVILLLLGGGAVGFVRGFVYEIISLLAWAAAIAMIKLFHTQLSGGLAHSVGTAEGASVLAFALLFIPTFIVVKILARSIGGGFGVVKGLLAATLFFLFANLATDLIYGPEAERPAWMTQSRTYPLLNASGRGIVDWVESRRHAREEAKE